MNKMVRGNELITRGKQFDWLKKTEEWQDRQNQAVMHRRVELQSAWGGGGGSSSGWYGGKGYGKDDGKDFGMDDGKGHGKMEGTGRGFHTPQWRCRSCGCNNNVTKQYCRMVECGKHWYNNVWYN
jgi:hypothetical protein